eukprot:1148080-Pelagomonas_calceolata.AAC.8
MHTKQIYLSTEPCTLRPGDRERASSSSQAGRHYRCRAKICEESVRKKAAAPADLAGTGRALPSQPARQCSFEPSHIAKSAAAPAGLAGTERALPYQVARQRRLGSSHAQITKSTPAPAGLASTPARPVQGPPEKTGGQAKCPYEFGREGCKGRCLCLMLPHGLGPERRQS